MVQMAYENLDSLDSGGDIIDGEAAVWIDSIPCYDGVFDSDGQPLDTEEPFKHYNAPVTPSPLMGDIMELLLCWVVFCAKPATETSSNVLT